MTDKWTRRIQAYDELHYDEVGAPNLQGMT